MKQFLKQCSIFSVMVTFVATNAGPVTFVNRSQSRYAIHQDAGSVGHKSDKQYDMEGWWGTAHADLGWMQTFWNDRLADCILGGSSCNITSNVTNSCGDCDDNDCDSRGFLIQGSTVSGRNASAWLADYFYLPTDFNGAFSISPKIQTFFADLTFFLGLDEWWEGAYFQIHGPIVYTRWNLHFKESITSAGTSAGGYPIGYFTPLAVANTSLLSSFRSYMDGNAPFGGSVTQADIGTVSHTITFQPLKYARMSCGSDNKVGFADLRAEFGWNFWRNEDYHMGINIQAAAPTGNRAHAEYVFSPVVGNGKHWELGGGLTGHYVFYRSTDGDKHFGFYGDLNVTHMFKAKEHRTFDLKGKPNSKYMLATKFSTNSQNLTGGATAGTSVAATKQFAEQYVPVANLTTLEVDISSAAQIDLVAQFNWTYKKLSWDLGYNFYYRSCEDIDCSDDCEPCDSNVNLCTSGQANTWALKGDSKMYGFPLTADTTAPILAQNQAVPLSATDSAATITNGDNFSSTVTPTNSVNTKVDNAQLAWAGGTPIQLNNYPTTITTPTPAQINTSIQPIFLQCTDIDRKGSRSMSHTVFTHLQYNFEHEDWTPYLGIGASAEFGQHSNDGDCETGCSTTTSTSSCSSDCESCETCTASYWSVWIKGGISFS